MTKVILDITMSLDGFVAGPNPTLDDPLGENGMLLHEWIFPLATWRAAHGLEGGEHNADDEVVARGLENLGPTVMGRRMFSGGSGPWEDDPNATGWWGDAPPFAGDVFVVTHHAREPLVFANGAVFHFVDGVEQAVARARDAAGGKDVRIAGGGSIASQCVSGGLVDELEIHVAAVLLGAGTRLFDGIGPTPLAGPVAHLTYRASAA